MPQGTGIEQIHVVQPFISEPSKQVPGAPRLKPGMPVSFAEVFKNRPSKKPTDFGKKLKGALDKQF